MNKVDYTSKLSKERSMKTIILNRYILQAVVLVLCTVHLWFINLAYLYGQQYHHVAHIISIYAIFIKPTSGTCLKYLFRQKSCGFVDNIIHVNNSYNIFVSILDFTALFTNLPHKFFFEIIVRHYYEDAGTGLFEFSESDVR